MGASRGIGWRTRILVRKAALGADRYAASKEQLACPRYLPDRVRKSGMQIFAATQPA